ncbi:TetR/AcrR family transcriptional regulator [Sphingomonas radiodurans]|uniref:TetR/AcrR family transcriptional regulator n=1 Tax=Sphingomonas radiodurans TaxID=2890321 RepID=UPI001E48A9AE|nr:TetR/AcrR family transcriptional regulator [Sphingomonas radiodurans]WBH17776.1 TetR/AcrR family transcriptional regulator [Sphingomonas radiodurans]
MATSFGAGELSPHPDKPLLYFSPMILARRRRLLKEARHMIAEGGLDGFSIRKLCQHAGVAQRTLYNAFQNKDRLIALAIREAFDEFQAYVLTGTDRESLQGWLSRTIAINRRNFRVRNYTKAVCAIYFAPTTPRDVWGTLQDMSLRGNGEWFAKRRADIHPWIDLDHFGHSMANVQYATINDWCLGRLTDEEYLPRLAENMLLLLIGVVHGTLAEEAAEYLTAIRNTGDVTAIVSPIADPPQRPREPEVVKEAPKKRKKKAE